MFAAMLTVSDGVRAECQEPIPPEDRLRRATIVTASGICIVTAWGVVNWDYFSRTPQAKSEGWFGRNTDEGGVDKFGHVFTTYAAAQGISRLFEYWCFSTEDAALCGSLSSLAILGYMEFGDAFSNYGFSYEDFIANAIGGIASYCRYRYPSLARKVDLRWEIGFNPNKGDITTDYENSKYLIALKLNGFDAFSKSILRHFEIHAGYYTRGYSDPDKRHKRNLYAGIGLNLTDLLRRHGYRKLATFLNYYQPPGTYAAADNQLGD
jgi:hypothetical protein